jgi:predicted metalloprotease with PDZ domain
MQVEARFPDVPTPTLELRMSRSSPGRYAIHDFSKNVYDVEAFDTAGRRLALSRPDPDGWSVNAQDSSVLVKYKVYGDVVDGTYLAIDSTHAHVNMPAAVMWARNMTDRPATLTWVPPAGTNWRIATQLHPGATPFDYEAPNLQYLMDSPVEFGPIAVREFTVGTRLFRFAVHHTGSDAEVDAFVKDVARIVRQEGAVFGEFPSYEPRSYTFLADYLPYASRDGMEHRNSTVMTEPGSIRLTRDSLLDTVAHEFFHCWNVERIRPRSLEPFDFDRANMSSELWLAEGFTQYYGPLIMHRSGLVGLGSTTDAMLEAIESVMLGSGRAFRSAEDMSRMAVFTDGGRPIDRTNWTNTVVSYYPYGAAIALALDLSLRDRSDSRVGLDDYMRQMWKVHGQPGGAQEGYVDRPYTSADAEARLAEISDATFAHDFFERYVRGRDVADYTTLLKRAGFVLRKRAAGRAWWGDVQIEPKDGRVRIAGAVAPGSPAYAAGLERDDEIRRVEGAAVNNPQDLFAILSRHRPGDRVRVSYLDRDEVEKSATVVLAEDPHLELVAVEATGGVLTPAQRMFRERWLGAK